jgi:hypothetical protein
MCATCQKKLAMDAAVTRADGLASASSVIRLSDAQRAFQGFGSISNREMSETGRTVPDMNEPLSRYNVTVTVRGGSRPGGMAQVGEHYQRAPSRQDHQRRHRHRARPVRRRNRRPGRRLRRAEPPGPVTWPLRRRPCPASFRPRGLTGATRPTPIGLRLVGACVDDYDYSSTVAADEALEAPWRPRSAHRCLWR